MSRLNLVAGGSGFIGSHLVRALRSAGEEVRILDLKAPSELLDGVEFIQGSVCDAAIVAQAVAGAETVFHLAANPHIWARDKAAFARINVGGTETMLRAARKTGVGRFVYVSSFTTLVGRERNHTLDETSEVDPDDTLGPYPRSKRLAELAVLAAVEEGFDAVIALPSAPVGPGDVGLTAPTRMIRDLASGRTPATLDCVLNLVDVRDVAVGLIAARDKGKAGARYLLGGDNLEMSALLDKLEAATGRSMPRRTVPPWLALAVARASEWLSDHVTGTPPAAPLTGVKLALSGARFDSSRAARDLGWRARPIDSALKDALAWLEREGLFTAR